jgi:hypothetical protein
MPEKKGTRSWWSARWIDFVCGFFVGIAFFGGATAARPGAGGFALGDLLKAALCCGVVFALFGHWLWPFLNRWRGSEETPNRRDEEPDHTRD